MIVTLLYSILFMLMMLVGCDGRMHATAKAWKGKVIYQMLTDRFDKTKTTLQPCSDLSTYCGGTFTGAKNRLQYIADLGVDAVWMSPFVANTPRGYHGYWAQDLYAVNEHFGTAEELKEFIEAAHALNLSIMADIVVNHMGEGMVDVPTLNPFNDTKFYHDCGCVDGDCCPKSCWVEDFSNKLQMLHCQLYGLPDLNQDLPDVANELNEWIRWMVSEFKIDGIRLDTVPYVKMEYWKTFTEASGVFSIGEVSSTDVSDIAAYVSAGAMDAVLQYPLYYAALNAFGRGQSFAGLSNALKDARSNFDDNALDMLGIFSENHDQPRFLHIRNDAQANKNMVLFTLSTQGMPIVYYGVEQGYAGGDGYEGSREPLWTSGFSTTKSWKGMYAFVQTILRFRRSSAFYEHAPTEIYSDSTFYAFSRGDALFALTNVGESGSTVTRSLSGFGIPWKKGTVVCNIFYSDTDCITIELDYKVEIKLNGGECKVYAPRGAGV